MVPGGKVRWMGTPVAISGRAGLAHLGRPLGDRDALLCPVPARRGRRAEETLAWCACELARVRDGWRQGSGFAGLHREGTFPV